MAVIPFCRKFKLHPVCYPSQVSVLRVTHTVLLDMVPHHFLTLGIFGAHLSDGTVLAETGPALVFPVDISAYGGIMQCTVLRADHLSKYSLYTYI